LHTAAKQNKVNATETSMNVFAPLFSCIVIILFLVSAQPVLHILQSFGQMGWVVPAVSEIIFCHSGVITAK